MDLAIAAWITTVARLQVAVVALFCAVKHGVAAQSVFELAVSTSVVECVAQLLELSVEQVCRRVGIPVLLASSIKKGLDCDGIPKPNKRRCKSYWDNWTRSKPGCPIVLKRPTSPSCSSTSPYSNTCPAGETEGFELGTLVEFEPDACDACPLRNRCTLSSVGHGRTVAINDNESLQRDLRVLQQTSTGRQKLRRRVTVEHRLAHISQRQGRRARYRGVRKNLFDRRRAAAVQNLETIQREQLKQAA